MVTQAIETYAAHKAACIMEDKAIADARAGLYGADVIADIVEKRKQRAGCVRLVLEKAAAETDACQRRALLSLVDRLG